LHNLIAMETCQAWTLNEQYYLKEKKVHLQNMTQHIKGANGQGIIASNELQHLDMIAGALAYFQMASKRVIDGVPMHIRQYLLAQFSQQADKLPARMLGAQVSMQQLMAEDPAIASKRTGLQVQQQSLAEMCRILRASTL
jgi:hypothetical protein